MKKRGYRGGRCGDFTGESSTALYSMCRSSNNVISDSRGMVQYDMAWYSAVHECWYKICEVQAALVMKVNSYSKMKSKVLQSVQCYVISIYRCAPLFQQFDRYYLSDVRCLPYLSQSGTVHGKKEREGVRQIDRGYVRESRERNESKKRTSGLQVTIK